HRQAYRKDLNTERRDADGVVQASHGHAALCTSFDPFRFSDRDFAASAIRGIDEDFAKGAVAVKIWKNIGMELKDINGRYVLADDPAFEPIYRDIEKHNRTLIAHQAEPDEAWQPPNPTGLDYPYYKENPFWYMYKKPDAPKKQQILDARDHLLAENPKLRVVGAHLGSMEDDLDGLGQRLRSEEHTSELQSLAYLVCRLLLEKKNKNGKEILAAYGSVKCSVEDLRAINQRKKEGDAFRNLYLCGRNRCKLLGLQRNRLQVYHY